MGKKVMSDYSCYCTTEQTKKDIELGAPIDNSLVCYEGFDIVYHNEDYSSILYAVIPTAEEMVGWLRSKGFRFKITDFEKGTIWKVAYGDWFDFNGNEDMNPKEATLTAIDAALEYLNKNIND